MPMGGVSVCKPIMARCAGLYAYYGGETYSLSGLAAIFLGKENSNGIAGPIYFTYDGQTLSEIRNEIEANMY